MMRPMKLAGSELMFGDGCLEYIKTVPCKRAFIVVGGKSMERSGVLAKVEGYFHENGAETAVFHGVEPDPHFSTVVKGAKEMKKFQPDMIVALGGGSAMDAAKSMWVYYEHPEMTPQERRQAWTKLEQTYKPHLDYEGDPFFSKGGFWQKQQHIFNDPFYYIDYVLAQTCAFMYKVKMMENYEEAWESYLKLCRLSAGKFYADMLHEVGLNVPYEEGCIEEMTKKLGEMIGV